MATEVLSAFAHGTNDRLRCRECPDGSDARPNGSHFLVNGENSGAPMDRSRYATLIARVPARRVVRDGQTDLDASPRRDREPTTRFIRRLSWTCPRRRPGPSTLSVRRVLRNRKRPHDDDGGPDSGRERDRRGRKGLKYAPDDFKRGARHQHPGHCLGMAKQAWQPTWIGQRSGDVSQTAGERQTSRFAWATWLRIFAMESALHAGVATGGSARHDIRIQAARREDFLLRAYDSISPGRTNSVRRHGVAKPRPPKWRGEAGIRDRTACAGRGDVSHR